ncbi:hypothetical protein HYU96_03665 [Candidatus Daviesbacteria bacterium]|nr:hypothetical protein [Candidatus Daviesbacteria bacterium]
MKLNRKLSFKVFLLSQLAILVIGLIFLITLYNFLYPESRNETAGPTGGPVTTLTKSLRIDLDQPDDNLLTFQSSLIISGSTLPGLAVLISTDTEDSVIESTKDGSFSTVIKLEEGVNNLMVIVFDEKGDSKSIERTIYYSREKL